MKIRLAHVVMASLMLADCGSPGREVLPSQGILFSTDYQPPSFPDSSRLEKARAAFPVIDQIFRDHQKKNDFPSVAFGIVLDGKLVHANAFGTANLSSTTAATTKTSFRIASMTKSFTAMAILKLRDAGKLNLQDPVSKYIQEAGSVAYLTQDSPSMTIENLLTMSAGFPEDNPWGDRQLADTDQELLALIKQGISFSNAPGLVFEYSNLGFGMLGRIVTVVSGIPYQQYINENILQPLAMNDTRWEFTEVPKEGLALGYRRVGDTWQEEPILHDGIFGAMGGLICSVEDFSKYLGFHLSAWPPRSGEESPVLKRSSLREMHQMQRVGRIFPESRTRRGELCPVVTGYGYGLGLRIDCKGLVSVRHGGGLPGYGSEWRFFPELGVGIVSLSNLTYGGLGLPNAKALDTLIYMAGMKARSLPISNILQQRQHQIVELLPNWSTEKLDILAENFFLDEPLDSWKGRATTLLEGSGRILKINEFIPENQLRGTFLMEGEKKNIRVFFTLTPEHNPLVQELTLELVEK